MPHQYHAQAIMLRQKKRLKLPASPAPLEDRMTVICHVGEVLGTSSAH